LINVGKFRERSFIRDLSLGTLWTKDELRIEPRAVAEGRFTVGTAGDGVTVNCIVTSRRCLVTRVLSGRHLKQQVPITTDRIFSLDATRTS
jgi:hypothetical protein